MKKPLILYRRFEPSVHFINENSKEPLFQLYHGVIRPFRICSTVG